MTYRLEALIILEFSTTMVITTILIPGTVSPKLMDGFVARMKIVIGLTLT